MAVYEEYEDLVATVAPEVVEQLAPPHPDPAAAVADQMPGLELPGALAAWWSWHNGTTASAGLGLPIGGSNLAFRSLEQTLDLWRMELDIARHCAEPDMPAQHFWPPAWIPVLADQDVSLAVDLAAPRRPGSVVFRERDMMAYNAPIGAHDLTQVVEWWSSLLRIGATTWDPDRRWAGAAGAWVTDEALVPDALRGNLIAYTPLSGERAPQFYPLFDF
jgi:cell wall assembly regulator SMI1